MNSLALKLDVTLDEQKQINQLLLNAGIKPQKRRFHCTIGFIYKMIPSHQEADDFGSLMMGKLQSFLDTCPQTFEVREAAFIFRHVIAFLPTPQTLQDLTPVNQHVHDWVKGLSKDKYNLNPQTTGVDFKPHMTLWRERRKTHHLKQLQQDLEKLPSPWALNLKSCSYTIL